MEDWSTRATLSPGGRRRALGYLLTMRAGNRKADRRKKISHKFTMNDIGIRVKLTFFHKSD